MTQILGGGLVEGLEVAGDKPGRLRALRQHDGPGVVQRAGERPVDVIVVGAGAGQQHGRNAAQVQRHRLIVHRWTGGPVSG